MERAGEIIKSNPSLAHRPQGPSETLARLPQSWDQAIQFLRDAGAPEWMIVLTEVAQDKRHDMAPHTLMLWKDKLSGVPDNFVCEALKLYRGEFFPSVDHILKEVDRLREAQSTAPGKSTWDKWKAEQSRGHVEGKLAKPEEIAEMIRGCNRVWDKAAMEGKLVSSGGRIDNHVEAKNRGGMDKSNIVGLEKSAATVDKAGAESARSEQTGHKSIAKMGQSEGLEA